MNLFSNGSVSKTDIVINIINDFIGNFTLSDIEKLSPDISNELIKKVLNQLKEQCKIESISKGRYAKWRKV